MIVYEVTLHVERAIESEFRAWLGPHVREILALPGFLGAEVFERIEPPADASQLVLCTQYRLRDAQVLSDYVAQHAPRLRAEGISRFGQRFRAERRVLGLEAAY